MDGSVAEIATSFAFEMHSDPMMVFDVDTLRILAVNQAAIETYRYGRDAFLSLRISDIRPAEERAWLRRFLDKEFPRGKRRTGSRHRTSDGDLLDVEVGLTPFEADGRRLAMAAIHDVSSFKTEIRRLLKEGWLSPACWLPAPVMIVRRDDMRCLYANALAHSLLEMARADLFDHALTSLMPDPAARRRLRRRLGHQDMITDFRTELRGGDGETRRVSLALNPVPFMGEQALAVVLYPGVDPDRTDRSGGARIRAQATA